MKRGHIAEVADQKILKAFQEGNSEALTYLYDNYLHVIYGICLKYLKERAEAQDATSEILEKFSDIKIPTDIKNLKSWIYVVSKNHCLMKLRKQKSQFVSISDTSDMEFMEEMHPIDKELQAQAEVEHLMACLETLRSEQKSCITLFYLKKTSYQEIVKDTGFELKKVKSYIQNGKRNLKICIESKSK